MGKKNRREVEEEELDEEQLELQRELAALAAMRQEQQAQQAAGSDDDEEEEKVNTYNKAAMEQKLDEITRDLPWVETLTTCEFPLNLQRNEVHDDLKREVRRLRLCV